MEQELRELITSPLPPATTTDETNKNSRMDLYERPPTAKELVNHRPTEEDRRLLLEKDMSDAHENAPYQTYGQSCRTLSCNSAQGLVCNKRFFCVCPSANSYWSRNKTSCSRCPNGWSIVNGKCLFVSSFALNWTDAFAYCKSFTAQLLTLLAAKMYSTFTLQRADINFIGEKI